MKNPPDASHLSIEEALEIFAQAIALRFRVRPIYCQIYTSKSKRVPITLFMQDLLRTETVLRQKDDDSGVIAGGNGRADDGETCDLPRDRVSRCMIDILAILEKAKHPMTTTRIMSELEKAGKEWSQRHVARFLAEMVRDGTLDNPPGTKPAGYRLPEWDKGCAEPEHN